MTLRERLEWLGRITLLVFILASAAFLSAITAMRVAIHGREVTMPNLVGMNVSEASKMLQSRGLVLRVADRIYSDQPINVVVRQTPTSGLLMKVSQQASLRASRIELLRAGLQVGEVSGVTMTEQPVDAVVIQNPKPGAGAATPRVDVLVSQGPRETAYVMPHLTGLNETDAQHRLDMAQMRRKVNYVTAPQWPHGAVIDQSPMSGTRIPASATIELTVAN